MHLLPSTSCRQSAACAMRGCYRSTPVILAATILVLAGCQKTVTKVAVSGTVTFDGEPVEDGQVAFEPLAGGEMEFGVITDGKYSIPSEFGLKSGKYLVRITADRNAHKKAERTSFTTEDDSLDIYEQFLPARYNTGSQLKVEIENAAEVQKDFSLRSS